MHSQCQLTSERREECLQNQKEKAESSLVEVSRTTVPAAVSLD